MMLEKVTAMARALPSALAASSWGSLPAIAFNSCARIFALRRSEQSWRRSCTALAGLPDRDAHLLRLVGEVGRYAGARENQHPDRQDIQYRIVALERRCLGVARPVGLECDLRHVSVVGPSRGDAFGALRAAAMHEDHVGMLGVDLVEPIPDQVMIVEVEAPGEGDLWSCGDQHFGLGAALRGGSRGCRSSPR